MTNQELIRYNQFLLAEMDLTRRRVIKLVYRGDSLNNLCERLNVDNNGDLTNIELILERLFMVGEKSRRYYSLDGNFNIDDTDDYVFEKISKYFKDSLKNKNPNCVYFFSRNKVLANFFADKHNKNRFLRIVENANHHERLHIRNYYLTLLHQLAAINYKNKSHFVSTSEDYKIAEKFARQNTDSNKVILHCWQPIRQEREIITKYDLPKYSLGPFDYQKEFSVLGGILPHFISGLELMSTNRFYPNPNIFCNEVSDQIFITGLEIDQTNFGKVLALTNYRRSLVTDGQSIWEGVTP